MQPKSRYGITIQIFEEQADTIDERISGDAPLSNKLEAIASGLVSDLADGGIMIPANLSDRIRSATGRLDAVDITERVEKTAKRKGDGPIVEWTPDPMWIGWLAEVAESNGLTLDAHVRAIFDYGFEQGYFGTGAPDPYKLLLTQEQFEGLCQSMGKEHITGKDICDVLLDQPKSSFVQAAGAEDIVDEVFKG